MKFRISSVVECLIYLFTLVAFNIALFGNIPGFQGISPHPYLVIVVLIAVLYGIKEGLVACFLSILVYVVQITGIDHQSLESIFQNAGHLKVLLIFIISAVVLGEIKEIHNRERKLLKNTLEETKAEFEKLKLKFDIVKKAKDELESRIIGQSASMFSLYEATKAVETLEIGKIYEALLNLVVKFIGAEKCSLFLFNEQQYKFINVANYHWSEEEKVMKSQVELGRGILGKVLEKGQLLTIRDIEENPKWKQLIEMEGGVETMLCAPIKVNARTVGVINIEKMPFIKLNASTVRMLAILMDLATPAIENAYLHQQARERDIYDAETSLIKYSYFLKRSEEELKRAMRYNLTFSLLVFEIAFDSAALSGVEQDDRNSFLKAVIQKVLSKIRSVDILSRYNKEGRLILLLPITDISGGLMVAEKLAVVLEGTPIPFQGKEIKIKVTFGLSGYKKGIEKFTQMVEKALLALEMALKENKKINVDADEK